MSAKAKRINFIYIALSLVFLFNPNISTIDLLPDFIGYILLCISLTKLADLNETISEAQTGFKRMIIVDVCKLLSLMWTFGMSVTTERESSLLLWAFVFGLLEIVIGVPAFIKLFKGLGELGNFYPNETVLAFNEKKNYTEKIKKATVIFIILKAVLCVLPEFSSLTTYSYEENAGIMNLYRFIGVLRLFAMLPVFIVGIVWIIRIILYFARLNKDKTFVDALSESYVNNVLPKDGLFVKRNIKLAKFILFFAILFSVDFRLENVNLLPDCISAVLFIAFFVIISMRTNLPKRFFITLSSVFALVTAYSWYSEYHFFKEYYYEAIFRSEEAMAEFIKMSAVSCIGILLFGDICIGVISSLKFVIAEHTGIERGLDEHNFKSYIGIARATRKELSRELWLCALATVLYIASDFCYMFLVSEYGFLTVLNAGIGILCACIYLKVFLDIEEAVESKYMLE